MSDRDYSNPRAVVTFCLTMFIVAFVAFVAYIELNK